VDTTLINSLETGGGIIGSTTAYYLTRHPSYNPALHTIHLIEATAIASGASGKAGGLLALWAYPSSIVPLSYRLHKELAKEHGGEKRWGFRGVGCGQLSIKGRRIGEAAAKGKGNPVKLNGVHEEAKERVSLQKRSKESYQSLQAAGVPEDLDWFVNSNIKSYDSMGTPENTAQVHPYLFTTSMAELAEKRGVKIILGSVTSINFKDKDANNGVESITYSAKTSTTNTQPEPQHLPATDIVLTAGPWTKSILPRAPIAALRAHSITIRPSRPNISPYAIFTDIALPANFRPGNKARKAQHVSPEIYARPNNELYACGEGDHLVPLPPNTAEVEVDESRCQDIADHCSSISDELRDGEITTRQACYLPQVEGGGDPLIGHAGLKGLYLAAGHTCWGIQNGPGTGKLMSEFVMEGEAKSARVAGLDPRRALT
jgi:glycine/D-amino acid oxidase-like deaminating enzyme